jgi:hypothetical protein
MALWIRSSTALWIDIITAKIKQTRHWWWQAGGALIGVGRVGSTRGTVNLATDPASQGGGSRSMTWRAENTD